MIYSKKYGRSFNNRQELGRFNWWMQRTKPVLPWFGLRDAPYSKEWLKENRPEPERLSWNDWMCILALSLAVLWFLFGMG